MRKVKFNVSCIASYQSSLEIPNDVSQGQELQYILDNLAKCDIESELQWLSDLEDEPVIQEDIYEVEKYGA